MNKPKKQIKICMPVIGKTLKDFLANLAKVQKKADLVELRVDYVQGFKIEDIDIIKKNLKTPAIFTCRAKKEGGQFQGNEKARLNIIQEALKIGFDYVDIELQSIDKIDVKNKHLKTKIICSYHDFKKTPTYRKLEKIQAKIKSKKCDIIKIVGMVKSKEDNQKLLRLLANKSEKEEIIVLGMGRQGKITRILAPLLGGYLTFASLNGAKSAPGQIDIKELERIYKTIN